MQAKKWLFSCLLVLASADLASAQLRPLEPATTTSQERATIGATNQASNLHEDESWVAHQVDSLFDSEMSSEVYRPAFVEGSIVAYSTIPKSSLLEPPRHEQPAAAKRLQATSFSTPSIEPPRIALASAMSEIGEDQSENANDAHVESNENEPPAEEEPNEKTDDEADLTKRLQNLKASISEDDQIESTLKTDRLELINAAQNSLINANKFRAKKEQYVEQLASFPDELERLNQDISEPEILEPEGIAKDASSVTLQADLRQLQQQLEEHQQAFDSYESEISNLNQRITEIPALRSKAEDESTKVKESLEKFPESSEDLDTQLRLMTQQARLISLEAEIEQFDAEARRQDLAGKVFPMRRDIVSRQIKRLESRIADLGTAIEALRQREIQQQAEQARLEAINAAPALKDLANRNQDLIQLRSNVSERATKAQKELDDITSMVESLVKEKADLEKEIEAVGGVNKTNGMMLVESRRRLAMPFESLARIKEIQAELQTINVALLTLDAEREPLADPADFVEEQIKSKSRTVFDENLTSMAVKFAQTKRQYLDGLLNDYNQYRGKLTNLEVKRRELVNQIEVNRAFIDEQALWVRNADPVSMSDFQNSGEAFGAFFDTAEWSAIGGELTARSKSKPHEAALGLCGFIILGLIARRLRN